MDVGSISAAISATSTAFEMISINLAAHDDAKITAVIKGLEELMTEVNNALFELAMKNLSAAEEIQVLKARNHELEINVMNLEQWIRERTQYRLSELSKGVFAYAYQSTPPDDTPPHYLCQPCMDNKAKKAVLQRAERGDSVYLTCPECHNDYPSGEVPPFMI